MAGILAVATQFCDSFLLLIAGFNLGHWGADVRSSRSEGVLRPVLGRRRPHP